MNKHLILDLKFFETFQIITIENNETKKGNIILTTNPPFTIVLKIINGYNYLDYAAKYQNEQTQKSKLTLWQQNSHTV